MLSTEQLFLTLDNLRFLVQSNMSFLLPMIIALWSIQVLNWLVNYRLNVLGIYPRSWSGLFGIVCSPFLHGSFGHLLINTLILIVLANFVLLSGKPVFYQVSLLVIFLGGFAVWLFGRRALHVGASGVVMGYWGYLLINAYYQRTALTLIVAGACLYYFGSLFVGLFPNSKGVSWEGHLFGFIAGILSVFILAYAW